MRAPAPAAIAEGYELVTGTFDDGMHWGHLRGYVRAPLTAVWGAYQQPDVVVDRRRVASWDGRLTADPDADFSQEIDHVVRDIVTLEYTLTWRHGAVGDPDAPAKVSMRWQKTHGSGLIDTLRGSVALFPTDDPAFVEVQSIEHLKAPRTSTDDIEGLLGDVWLDVVAWAHGRALPTYD
jgi:hypothetical protein